MDALSELLRLPPFAGWRSDALTPLAQALKPFEAPLGAQLFRQNDEAHGMHLLVEGRVAIESRTLADGVVRLAELGAGDLLGEFQLMDSGRRSAGAVALAPACGFTLDRETFQRLIFVGDAATAALARHVRGLACTRTRATLAALAAAPAAPGEVRAAPETSPAAAVDTGEPRHAMLHALHQFQGFAHEDIERLMAAGAVLSAPRGAILAHADASPESLWVVMRGAVRLGLPRPDGVEQLLIQGPGKITGAVAALDGLNQPARLDIWEEAILLALPCATVRALNTADEPGAARFMDLVGRQLATDLRTLSRRQGRQRSLAALNASKTPGEAAHV
jgi:CRP-like cAMP-binding protein